MKCKIVIERVYYELTSVNQLTKLFEVVRGSCDVFVSNFTDLPNWIVRGIKESRLQWTEGVECSCITITK